MEVTGNVFCFPTRRKVDLVRERERDRELGGRERERGEERRGGGREREGEEEEGRRRKGEA